MTHLPSSHAKKKPNWLDIEHRPFVLIKPHPTLVQRNWFYFIKQFIRHRVQQIFLSTPIHKVFCWKIHHNRLPIKIICTNFPGVIFTLKVLNSKGDVSFANIPNYPEKTFSCIGDIAPLTHLHYSFQVRGFFAMLSALYSFVSQSTMKNFGLIEN